MSAAAPAMPSVTDRCSCCREELRCGASCACDEFECERCTCWRCQRRRVKPTGKAEPFCAHCLHMLDPDP